MKINRDQFVISRIKKISFDYKRGSGHLLNYLLNRMKWHLYPRFQYVSKFPDHIDIETSSVCNMECPMCPTLADEFKNKVTKKFMELELFKKIIDECARHRAYSIRISLRGDPFINKNIITMIRYAKEKGIKEVSSLTNNLALTPQLFKEAMEAGLDWLTISFDGLGDTYEWIRKPAKFTESYAKIKEYKRIKEQARVFKPVIKIQTVWPAIKDCTKEYCDAFNPYVDNITINPLIDYLHKDKEIVYLDNFVCPVLYQRLVIGSDGIALLCSNDECCLYPLGDAKRENLYDIWHGQRLTRARQIHKQYRGVELLDSCKRCYLPRATFSVVEDIGAKRITIDKYINRVDEIGA